MNKTELSKHISLRMSVKQVEALRFLQTFEEVVEEVLKAEENIIFQNFGTFSLWQQTERQGRNPKTGEPVIIKARKSIKFKPGKHLLDTLNK